MCYVYWDLIAGADVSCFITMYDPPFFLIKQWLQYGAFEQKPEP